MTWILVVVLSYGEILHIPHATLEACQVHAERIARSYRAIPDPDFTIELSCEPMELEENRYDSDEGAQEVQEESKVPSQA